MRGGGHVELHAGAQGCEHAVADVERSRRDAIAGECHADDGRGGVQPHVNFDGEVFELNLG